jgi:putative Ca2+/H+ antiporter (TMEM165/GDT1 family)
MKSVQVLSCDFVPVQEGESELEEVERELGSKQAKAGVKNSINGDAGRKAGIMGRLKTLFPPVFLEAFVLTFLAEWGDRSQVTILPRLSGGCVELRDHAKYDCSKSRIIGYESLGSQSADAACCHGMSPCVAVSAASLMVQIATIGLAASTDVVGVTIGGIVGHAICTGAAVIGGRQLSAHIDERMLSILGGLLFIAFGLHAVWEVRTDWHCSAVLCI